MKHNLMATANATALTVGFLYVACVLLVGLFPDFYKAVSISWFHGLDISKIWVGGQRSDFLLGLVTIVVGGWVTGWVFAWSYNRFVK